MKLFTRYNRINLLSTIIVFLLSGISFYFLLRFILIGQVDEDLKIEQHEIQSYAGKYQRLPEIIAVKDQHISYTLADKDGGKRIFRTVTRVNGVATENNIFRQLIFYISAGGQWYLATVSKSLEGTDNLIQSIVTITLITILLILMVSLLINRLVLKKLWQPFYETLKAMRQFELGKQQALLFPATSIDEFIVMNDTLKQATTKADLEYRYLKEFTENASHELQTPLAIIQSKLDLLIQDEQLSEQQSRAVQAAYEAIQRLSRLNQALLLLIKIENGQYTEIASINLSQKIKDKIVQFEELIAAKNITVHTQLNGMMDEKMNPILTDILLNNLFSNAIKYNLPGGIINIQVTEEIIDISNSGDPAPLDKSRLFRRFGKTSQIRDGAGLGLAIVQQAAEVAGFTADYVYENHLHHFLLHRKKIRPVTMNTYE